MVVRIGTAEIYREVEQIEEVVESVAVEQEVMDPRSDAPAESRVVLFVRLRPGLTLDEELRDRILRRKAELDAVILEGGGDFGFSHGQKGNKGKGNKGTEGTKAGSAFGMSLSSPISFSSLP